MTISSRGSSARCAGWASTGTRAPTASPSGPRAYQAAADRLREQGLTYYCDCTADDVKARVKDDSGYDGFCRDRGLTAGALRFRTPDDGQTVVHDMIRGDVTFEHAAIEDFVVQRRDGSAMFLLANAVDDMDMAITHVIRGEDLLATTPKVLLIREALGDEHPPVYAHVPLIVNEKRQKLSKRRDDVAIEDYRERGYLPEAMRNYLALLGWSPANDREILPIEDMVAEFRIEDVKASPAFFDVKKLDAINAEYIRALPVATFVRECLPWLETDAALAAGALRPRRLRSRRAAGAGAGPHAGRGAGAWSTSCSSSSRRSTRRRGTRRSRGTRRRPACWRRPSPATGTPAGTPTSSTG